MFEQFLKQVKYIYKLNNMHNTNISYKQVKYI